MTDTGNSTDTSDSGEKESLGLGKTEIILIIAGIIFVWIVMVIIALYCCCKKSGKSNKKKKGTKKVNSDEAWIIGKNKGETSTSVSIEEPVPHKPYVNDNIEGGTDRTVTHDLMGLIENAMRRTVESYVIESKRLELQDVIGSGGFGKVYKGLLLDKNLQNPKVVAVKTIHGNNSNSETITKFIQEVMMMKGFMHKNVLTMTGLVLRQNVPYVILPYMENGDLKTFLGNSDKEFLVKDLLEMAVQVADGMAYLTEQNYVHRDLAARNCMVDRNLVIKVADFGLSRDIFCDDYYVMEEANTPLPVRWMALESLQNAVFSKKTDVWSYGVVLWEIMTRGQQPYSGLSNVQVVKHVTDGNRLAEPPFSPPGVYKIMCRCWSSDSAQRPTCQQIAKELRELLAAKPQGKKSNKAGKDTKQYYNVAKSNKNKKK